MPLANSYNSLAQSNEMPLYQSLWEPLAVDPSSAGAVVFPTAAGAGAWVPGALVTFNTAGVGSYPPLGYGNTTAQAGGDSGNSGNPTFPNNWTVQYVDLAPVSSTTYLAGILLGVGTLGAPAPVVPNTVNGPGPAFVAMVAKRGIVQVLVDNTTTIGHTVIASTTSAHTGQVSDSGGSSFTWGTTLGIFLQAVTVSAGPKLAWAAINMPV